MIYAVLVFMVSMFILYGIVFGIYIIYYNHKINEYRKEVLEAMYVSILNDNGIAYDMVDVDLFKKELKKIFDKYMIDIV